jgi:hypothetical protein
MGPVKRADYEAGLVLAYAFANSIRRLPLDELLTAIEHADAFGPFIDPTLHRRNSKKLDQDRSVVVALLEAKHALDKLPWPELVDVSRRPFSVERADAERDGDASPAVLGQAVQ